MNLPSASIRIKIIAVIIVGFLGLGVSLAFNYSVSNSNAVRLEKVRDIYFPTLERLDADLVRLGKIKETFSAAVISGEEELLDYAEELADQFVQALQHISELDGSEQSRVTALEKSFSSYMTSATKLSRGMLQESLAPEKMQPLLKEMEQRLILTEDQLKSFRAVSYERFIGAIDGANRASHEALVNGSIIGVLTTLVLVLAGMLIANSITRNISQVNQSLKALASGDGDLTIRLESKSNDEIGTLVDNFNVFLDKLQNLISNVVSVTGRLTASAEKMSEVSVQTSANIKRQQAQTEMISTAMTELTSSAEAVAAHALEGEKAATSADQAANEGHQVVTQSVDSINRLAGDIKRAAQKIHVLGNDAENIGAVLDVIKAVAEQTNLLALNAAIEAARAGDQGRGFSVVADEVRTLAQRTQQSTSEIQTVITKLQEGAREAILAMDDSQQQAEVSVSEAVKAGDSLNMITEAVKAINAMNAEISAAAEEQSTVAREAENNILEISNVGEDAVKCVETTETASNDVAELSAELNKLVSMFKI